ncbi:MAG: flagellar biosynthetic protein FliR [Acidobacteria bacterium]|nr:flagellar biosynthetic protein FliR [Acidobacteriota bacterium]
MNEAVPLAAFGVLMVRPGVLIVATPLFGGAFVPPPVRVALTAILGLILVPLVQVPPNLPPLGLAVMVAGEAVVGLALALAVHALIGAAEFAGHVVGFQIGLSYAAIVDPQSGVRNNLIASLYGTLATITFFGINGHLALIRTLVQSYTTLPPGHWGAQDAIAGSVTQLLGIVFVLGTQLSMPVIIALLLVELVMGLVSRAAPALNLMVIGFPVRLSVGLLVLAFGIHVVPEAVARHAPSVLAAAWRLVGAVR